MPPCYVDYKTSPTFRALVEHYKKLFPNIEKDLDEIWVDIALDHRNARQAEAIIRFDGKLFKYRAPCSDQNRGSKGGYRVCAYYNRDNNTLYPILVWPKTEASDLDYKTKNKAVKELQAIINKRDPSQK